ncbi:MAG: glycerol-3-phosphate 1-O-acyltransferase PlsY [Thalassobaculaceae bacterium]|nr:glycerol-3-phosphate 1-O-acyltransferase PlsY [Thalassobaculaceae bacterium]
MGTLEYTWPFYAGFLLAYLLGSIPFGLVLTRISGLGDIRAIGSHNIGATNVLRTGRKGLAAATLLLDAGKGAVAVAVAWQFGADMALLAAIGAVLGHCFPIWLRFKGGKGVATAIGVWLALVPDVAVIVCGLWLLIAGVFRYSSVAALVSLAAAPLLAWHMEGPQFAEAGGVIAAVIWLRHHQNIRRLLKGEETRISFKKK